MNGTVSSPQILLVEPHFVLRRTIVSVARDLGVARLHEATHGEAAAALLAAKRFDGLVLDIGAGAASLDLLARLRRGGFASDADIPVVAMTSEAGAAVEAQVEPYAVFRLIRKPFKVGELLQALQAMAARPA